MAAASFPLGFGIEVGDLQKEGRGGWRGGERSRGGGELCPFQKDGWQRCGEWEGGGLCGVPEAGRVVLWELKEGGREGREAKLDVETPQSQRWGHPKSSRPWSLSPG